MTGSKETLIEVFVVPNRMNKESVESYLQHGCGRCDKFRTPDCKVHLWTGALAELRKIVRSTELTEELKWGAPCYTLDRKNVVAISALNEYCALSFFKGALLTDGSGMLEAPGPNSQAARLLKFTSATGVRKHRALIRRLVEEAIALEKAGKKVAFKKSPEPVPSELQEVLDADPALAAAFKKLTPGRQRSHILHIAGAKQSQTRTKRAHKCAEKILAGKGFHDR